jgi:hypothetical protein
MTIAYDSIFRWKPSHGSSIARRQRVAATAARRPTAIEHEYAAIGARITPVLTDLAPHAPSLCAWITPHGDVVLEGRVTSRALADEAAKQIAAIPGVRRVHNLLYTDEQIADLISAALALDERTTWEQIRVAVDDGQVTLQGLVSSPEARAAAAEIAWHAPMVRRVQNALIVEAAREPATGALVATTSPEAPTTNGVRPPARSRFAFGWQIWPIGRGRWQPEPRR